MTQTFPSENLAVYNLTLWFLIILTSRRCENKTEKEGKVEDLVASVPTHSSVSAILPAILPLYLHHR